MQIEIRYLYAKEHHYVTTWNYNEITVCFSISPSKWYMYMRVRKCVPSCVLVYGCKFLLKVLIQQDTIYVIAQTRTSAALIHVCKHFYTVLPKYDFARHKLAWQSRIMTYPPAAVGVGGNMYTRIAIKRCSHAFFAVDFEIHVHILSVKLILKKQGNQTSDYLSAPI